MNIPNAADLAPKGITPQPLVPEGMRTFTVYRENDESGVSGTGKVIQGCLFANGKCAIQWLCKPDPGDTTIKDWEKFLDVHVRSHPENKTIITWDDHTQDTYPENPESNTDSNVISPFINPLEQPSQNL